MAEQEPVKEASEVSSQPEEVKTETAAPETAEPKVEEVKEAEPQGKEYQKLRKRAQQAEQEREYYRGLAEAGKKLEPPVQQPSGPPKLESYENYDDYLVAKAKFEVRQEQTIESQRETVRRIQDSYNEKFLKVQEKHPDLPQLV